MKNGKVEFKVPDELLKYVGEASPGTALELMANFRVKDDGRWCIASVEGIPFPGYDADGNPEESDDRPMEMKSEFAGRVENEMGRGGYG